MSQNRETLKDRCSVCEINNRWCFCYKIPSINNKTPTAVIIHIKESSLTSNTARLALKSLNNSSHYIRGQKFNETVLDIKKDHHQLYLYPHEDSEVLTKELVHSIEKPIQLIVPDASWKQARKIRKREKLDHLQTVRLPLEIKGNYTLRNSGDENSLCTIEAIAYALGIIESEDVRDELLNIFEVKQAAVKESRQNTYEA
jgi:DTW domain-containing protein YfiP